MFSKIASFFKKQKKEEESDNPLLDLWNGYVEIANEMINYYFEKGIERSKKEDFDFSYCYDSFIPCETPLMDRNLPEWKKLEKLVFKGIEAREKYIRIPAIYIASTCCEGDTVFQERLIKALKSSRFLDYETVYVTAAVSGSSLTSPEMLDWLFTQTLSNTGELSIPLKSLSPKNAPAALLQCVSFMVFHIYANNEIEKFESLKSYLDHQSWETKTIAAVVLNMLACMEIIDPTKTLAYFLELEKELEQNNYYRANYLRVEVINYIKDLVFSISNAR